MIGARGRKRRQMFMELIHKIPKLQSHEELELKYAFSRRLVCTDSSADKASATAAAAATPETLTLHVTDLVNRSDSDILDDDAHTPSVAMSDAARFRM